MEERGHAGRGGGIEVAGGEAAPGRGSLLAAFLLPLVLYLSTMNRTIGYVDRGELAATTATLGIPHPTGYPTFTLLGAAVLRLVPLRPVLVLNTLAAVLVALGAMTLVPLFDAVLRIAAPDAPGGQRHRAALLAGLGTALTATWWQQANGWEVYALQAVLLPAVVLLFLKWVEGRADALRGGGMRGFAFALVLGLSFTNHLTTVLLAPGLLTYAVLRIGPRRLLARAPGLIAGLTLGLLPYAWLPLRSSRGPRFDWSATHTLHGFLDHVTGREYRGWMFDRADSILDQASYVAWRLPWDYSFVGLALSGLGAVWMFRRRRALGILIVLVVLAGVGFAAGYRIRELDPYLMTSVLGLGAMLAAGILWTEQRLGRPAAMTVGTGLLILNGVLHVSACNERNHRAVEDLVRNELGPLPARSVLFTTQWDYGLSASYYFQAVEGFRRDVLVVSPKLLRFRWYLDELERRDRDLLSRVAVEAQRYREALRPFDAHQPYDRRVIAAAYGAFLDAFAGRAMTDRPVYATLESQGSFSPEWNRVPEGLAMRLTPSRAYRPDTTAFRIRSWPDRKDAYAATTHWIYAQALVQRAAYESRHGYEANAADALRRAATFDPHIERWPNEPQPLDGRTLIDQTAAFFAQLERRGSASPRH